MAELHNALSYLGPVSWDTIPISSPDELLKYTQGVFSQASLAIESVPEQTPSTDADSNSGSSSRTSIQQLSEPEFSNLRKEWGKPLKMNNAKENPLNIPMYKMQGKDGKGAWFARRSVHKGLPFARWKAKMKVELEETLKGRQEELKRGQQTPTMSVRGIGCDEKLEDNLRVRDSTSGEDVALLEVYKLSAQFPGPTTARDFVTLVMTTDSILEGQEAEGGNMFMVVSKPCSHPEAPPRDGYIRGQYESVELIRELSSQESESTGQTGKATDESASSADDQNNPNPVEWIMITRSDPGGSVPKWMVERGTPKSITGDAVKFLNWASQPDVSDKGDTADILEVTQDPDAIGTENKGAEQINQSIASFQDTDGTSTGLWSSVTNMINAGIESYVPEAVSNYIPGQLPQFSDNEDRDRAVSKKSEADKENDDDTSSLASNDSFTSAESNFPPSVSTNHLRPDSIKDSFKSSAVSGSSHDTDGAEAIITAQKDTKTKPSSKEKDLAKLQSRKREIETKLTTIQSEIEALGGTVVKDATSGASDNESDHTSTSSAGLNTKNQDNDAKAVVPDQKRIARLSRTEAKLNSQLRKIDEQQLKLVKKMEARQHKTAEREEKARSRSEVESLRKEVSALKTEVRELRGERQKWLDILNSLQKELTANRNDD
ncbi:hypothetical protein BGW36DRAFT_302666 [Talaromyces proteolyticus]|uniref:DUF3074 domain-containing protein n=1 Tax=Talaromyces proteolyticus TaxID=1131652 RepID=A0AAD4PWV2_9EURO|nr:uncharacterized protein BGW36DRAFT_302666 [Talaromyces proteolyticus]KAH8692837.1 hypothetical protein BGW36DRAFT_302666 [Talaromyces proteolyticus]